MISQQEILEKFGLDNISQGALSVRSPVDGAELARVKMHSSSDVDIAVQKSQKAFEAWRAVPAPIRGEFVRLLGVELRVEKEALGALVTIECGKVLSEGLGEVQEMIDICDFAVGLSRQLYGLTIASERPSHHMREMWHPLGVVGIISAFNFPVAVWSWNAALALVCGNSLIWKPSEKTPLTALACQKLFDRAVTKFREMGHTVPDDLSQVLIGERDVGEALTGHNGVPLVSATGSTRMGREVGKVVAERFGKSILELGGNNAIIVTEHADLDAALPAIAFGAVGTAGQRCTSTRRLIVHESVYDTLMTKLEKAYGQFRIGNPLKDGVLIGPLIDEPSFDAMREALVQAEKEGGRIVCGGARVTIEGCEQGVYVSPALVEMPSQTDVVREETFAPILYCMKYSSFDQAISMHNDVPQGLSSAIFTQNVKQAEMFVSAIGSDCGIANVNIGTSGAEIGGAFGGEKQTGGGRESGSDSWKAYMRRQTQTISYSDDLVLAQGVSFDL